MSNLGIGQTAITGAGGSGSGAANLTFRGVWSNVTSYALNDVVTRKGSSYVALQGNTGVDPYTDTGGTNWSLMTQGFNYVGTWSNITSYNYFDVVTLNNSFYLSVLAGEQTNTNHNPQTDGGTNWVLLDQGFKFSGTWSGATTYQPYDVIVYNSSTYVGLTLNNLNNIPSSSPTQWALMAPAGQVAPRQTFIFTMPKATVSNIALTSNVVTVTTAAAHGFVTGNTVYMNGLTTSLYLNGQVLTIASTPTGSTFTANFTHANDTTHSDTGTATRSIPDNGVFNTTIPLGKTFALSRVQCVQATRIELYSTVAARTADSSRPPNTQPAVGTQHGVIVDLYLDGVVASFASWVLSPLAYGANLEDGTVNIPAALTNISGAPSTNTFSVTFVFTYEEQ